MKLNSEDMRKINGIFDLFGLPNGAPSREQISDAMTGLITVTAYLIAKGSRSVADVDEASGAAAAHLKESAHSAYRFFKGN